jgi:tetratricopeptide (TPR) repeat protein
MSKDQRRLKEQEGVGYFRFLCAKLNYLCRDVVHHDKGVDCEIEITQSLDVESPIIAVQIKSWTEFYVTKENEITLTVSQQNLEYWRKYGRPVILVAYSDHEKPLYWTRVDNLKDRTVKISLNNKFDEDTLPKFSEIISSYYKKVVRGLKTKDVSQILVEFGFSDTLDKVIDPITESLKEAEEFIRDQRFEEAAEVYRSLARIYKQCPIYYNLGICLLHLDEIDEVFEVADFLYRKFPDRYEPLELLGNAFASIGEYEAAEEYLKKALAIEPQSPNIWNSLGLINYWQGNYAKAIEEFTTSLKYNSDAFVYYNLALCSTAIKKYEDALNYYDRALELNNKFYDAYNNKGLLFKSLWRFPEAISCFERAIELNPTYYYALCNCAYLLKDLGNNDKAISYYKQALELQPDHEHIHFNLALLYCRKSNLVKAEYHFARSINSLNISQTDIYENEVKLEGLIDVGYEVAYLIKIEVTKQSTRVVSVDDCSELALFKKIPLIRDIVDYSHANKLTKPLINIDPSGDFQKHKENQLRQRNYLNKRKRKNNTKGIWMFFAIRGENTQKSGTPSAIYMIEDVNYFRKLKKEILRRAKLIDIYDQEDIHTVEVDGEKIQVSCVDKLDSNGTIEFNFEKRITGDIYFKINFNGYYLSGILLDNNDHLISSLKKSFNNSKSFKIILQCITELGLVEMFSIHGIKNVVFKL